MMLRLVSTMVAISVMYGTAAAQITAIPPFVGDASDDFTALVGTPIHVLTANIFQGNATVNILTSGGSITVTVWSSLGGDLVQARSQPLMIGQLGVMEWVFHTPIKQFGGYFENNSRFDDAELEFYDAQDQLIGTATATVPEGGQTWIWNGWESDTPIHRIVSRGNDVEFLEGFIWYDDMEIVFADPPTLAESMAIEIGSLDSGGLPELADSDDQYLVMDPAFGPFRYRLVYTVDATSPTDSPAALDFNYESKTFNIVGTVEQDIELFNYDTGQYETIDTRNTTSTDSVVSVTPTGDPTRFVQAGTGAMRARISYQNSISFWIFVFSAFFLPYETSVDHIFWNITP